MIDEEALQDRIRGEEYGKIVQQLGDLKEKVQEFKDLHQDLNLCEKQWTLDENGELTLQTLDSYAKQLEKQMKKIHSLPRDFLFTDSYITDVSESFEKDFLIVNGEKEFKNIVETPISVLIYGDKYSYKAVHILMSTALNILKETLGINIGICPPGPFFFALNTIIEFPEKYGILIFYNKKVINALGAEDIANIIAEAFSRGTEYSLTKGERDVLSIADKIYNIIINAE